MSKDQFENSKDLLFCHLNVFVLDNLLYDIITKQL